MLIRTLHTGLTQLYILVTCHFNILVSGLGLPPPFCCASVKNFSPSCEFTNSSLTFSSSATSFFISFSGSGSEPLCSSFSIAMELLIPSILVSSFIVMLSNVSAGVGDFLMHRKLQVARTIAERTTSHPASRKTNMYFFVVSRRRPEREDGGTGTRMSGQNELQFQPPASLVNCQQLCRDTGWGV